MKRFLACALVLCVSTTSIAQSAVDLATIARIKQEGLANSQVMDHVSWLSDVHGPRSPARHNCSRRASGP